MPQADSENSTAAPGGRSFTPDTARLVKQDAKRRRAINRLRKLRAKAADEIDRLLDFLDASDIDPDLEPTLGFMNGPPEMDGCESPEDDEPSLGSLDRTEQTNWAGGSSNDCEGDEHDGREPENEGGEAVHEDDEPSLGWTDEETATGRTYAGAMGNSADLEHGEPVPAPQNCTSIERNVTVDVSYRRFVRGVTPEQRKRLKAAQKAARVGHDVVIA